jgi:hypothetical protein
MFHGMWLAVIGAMVWVPRMVPKGCSLVREDGRDTVRCHDKASLHRARALVNLQFGWYLSFTTVFVLAVYKRTPGSSRMPATRRRTSAGCRVTLASRHWRLRCNLCVKL